MSIKSIQISTQSGKTLQAQLELPATNKPTHYAIFAHCFACNSNVEALRNISRSLTNHGFGVLQFDFTGLGVQSDQQSSIGANIQDLMEAYAFMEKEYEAPALLVGHSLGGTASIIAGSKLDGVKAIATIGAPSTTNHASALYGHTKDASDDAQIKRNFQVDQEFEKQYEGEKVLDIVKKMRKKALLIMHSPVDRIVSPDHAHHLFINAFHPKSFVALDGADHQLTKERDSKYAGNVIGSWASRFMPEKADKSLTLQSEQLVAYLNAAEDKFTTSIQMNKHFITADEPESVGGNDFGPSPYELLMSSLAACTAMTLKLYAQQKNWDLEEVYVYSDHSKKHLQDIKDGESAKLDHMNKRLVLVGDLTYEQQTELLEIAENCPVHKTLQSDVIIDTSLSAGSDFYI